MIPRSSFLRFPKASLKNPVVASTGQDHDGLLRAEEITAYVKGEHHFDLAEDFDDGKTFVFCCFFSMGFGIRVEVTTRKL